MTIEKLKKIVIVGGGTAGWIAAACLAKLFKPQGVAIELVESPDIPTVGVGEATIPPILNYLSLLNIDERDFIRKTHATFKLGIKFTDWRVKGEYYWHQFGTVGSNIDGIAFYQHWLKSLQRGAVTQFTDFAPAIAMASDNKFAKVPPNDTSIMAGAKYALHFDAGLVAKYLQDYSVGLGAVHHLANVVQVKQGDNGFIESLELDTEAQLNGDFFVDCTGFSGLLIDKTLNVGFEDWSHFLPCNSAVVAQTHNAKNLFPYTQSTARESGWQWHIPLQNRAGNGYVYCNSFTTDQAAEQHFIGGLKEKMITEPRVLRFTTGKRKEIWSKNCLALGLASGFLEPLESTSIHLVMKAILKFVEMFPTKDCPVATLKEFNRVMDIEYSCIRDFIVLHYCTTQRTDTEFWRHCGSMAIPDSLAEKIELFKAQGRLYKNELDLFTANSWYAVLEGMGIRPRAYDPLVDFSAVPEVEQQMANALATLHAIVPRLPSHEDFIQEHCSAFPKERVLA